MIGAGVTHPRIYLICKTFKKKEWYLAYVDLDEIGHRGRKWTRQVEQAMLFDHADEAEIVAKVALDDGDEFQVKYTSRR